MNLSSANTSLFFNYLVEKNSIKDFDSWFFYSGMMFGSEDKWWGKGGMRSSPHEGLDICFYIDLKGNMGRLDERSLVPAMYDGFVFEISDDDYIGKSIFLRHDHKDSNGFFLHSVYAHAMPVSTISRGEKIKRGDIIAHVADVRNKNIALPSHLHVSMVYLPEDYPLDMLKWSVLSMTYQARLVDPLAYLDCNYSVKSYTGTEGEFQDNLS